MQRFKPIPLSAAVVSALAMLALSACGGSDNADSPQSTQPPAQTPAAQPSQPVVTAPEAGVTFLSPAAGVASACAALKGTQVSSGFPANTVIAFTRVNAATSAVPEHCEIKGTINGGRIGADGQTYAIKWHMRLPSQWNGRFYFEGGGGLNGSLGDANGSSAGTASALTQRYAVVSTDSGHANAADADFGALDSVNFTPTNGPNQFAFDPQARLDHGFRSYGWVTEAAKATLQMYYRHAPYYSYFNGCSEGGREALLMSQRYPEYFSGIVAGNPGMDLPKASIAEAWDSQQFAAAASSLGQFTDSGDPWLGKAFTNAQLTAVGNAILSACDATDGIADGMVLNPEACTFDPASLGPTGSNVLTTQQVATLKNIFAGPKNSRGESLYAGWFWDPGLAGSGWRAWKMGSDQPSSTGAKANSALNVSPFAGGGAIAYVFSTPPNRPTKSGVTVTAPALSPDALTKYVLSFDMDSDAPSFYATSGIFTTSEYNAMYTSSTNYDRFSANKGKLLIYTGAADPVFSAKYHVDWYKQLMSKYGSASNVQNFARLFVVPGMNHCGGGTATDNFDAFASVVNWVEKGTAPTSLLASARTTNSDLQLLSTPIPATRTRPLCPYPQFAKWVGKAGDDVNDAKNFSCQ